MHQIHKAGEKTFVDWVGPTMKVVDRRSRELQTAYLFVGVLGASELFYTEAFPSMDMISWITAHVHMFDYFGGTTDILVPDNLKTGVKQSCYYSPEIHPTYLEMAEFKEARVAPDYHVEFKGNFYSVPYRFDNCKPLILLSLVSGMLQTRYKRMASHYSSPHLKICVKLKVHTHLTETLHIGLSFIFVPLVQQFDNLLIFLRFHHRITFQLAQCICILFVGFLHKFYMTLLQFL